MPLVLKKKMEEKNARKKAKNERNAPGKASKPVEEKLGVVSGLKDMERKAEGEKENVIWGDMKGEEGLDEIEMSLVNNTEEDISTEMSQVNNTEEDINIDIDAAENNIIITESRAAR